MFSGFYTGSSYLDAELKENGFLGEGVVNSSVLTIKSHFPYITDNQQFLPSKVILLVRKPIDAFIAEFYRALTENHTGVVELKPDMINRTTWNTYVHTNLTGWHILHKFWLGRQNVAFHFVHFENLKKDFANELKKVLAFLDFKPSMVNMKCVLKNKDGSFKRKTLDRHHRRMLLQLLDKKTKLRLAHVYSGIVGIINTKRFLRKES